MARIRNIKPEFFQHEELFELGEESGHGMALRIAFQGLWCEADLQGLFAWKPRRLKLRTLPWDDVDMSAILDVLEGGGFVRRYEVAGKSYGWIPTFKDHQRVSGSETKSGPMHPEPTGLEGYEPWGGRESVTSASSSTQDASNPNPKDAPVTHLGTTHDAPMTHPCRPEESQKVYPVALDLGLRTQDLGLRTEEKDTARVRGAPGGAYLSPPSEGGSEQAEAGPEPKTCLSGPGDPPPEDERPAQPPKKARSAPIPVAAMIESYNEVIATGTRWAACTKQPKPLKESLRARWGDCGASLEGWRAYLQTIRNSKFLIEDKQGHGSIAWVVGRRNCSEVLLGKYGEIAEARVEAPDPPPPKPSLGETRERCPEVAKNDDEDVEVFSRKLWREDRAAWEERTGWKFDEWNNRFGEAS